MNDPSQANAAPGARLDVHGSERGRRAPMVATPLRMLLLWVGSLAVMAPWPLLGILLTRSAFDEATEAFFMFGGITMFPLMVLALFGSPPEAVLIVLIMLVWVAAVVVPGLWLRRRLGSWVAIGALLGSQTAFSFAQAVMGALLVIGKNV